MVLSCKALADTVLHKTRQRRKYVDRRINAFIIKVTVKNYLTLGNITRKVGNGVRNIVVGHCKNRYLRNGALNALYHTGTLIK